jgi:hypothetical protein
MAIGSNFLTTMPLAGSKSLSGRTSFGQIAVRSCDGHEAGKYQGASFQVSTSKGRRGLGTHYRKAPYGPGMWSVSAPLWWRPSCRPLATKGRASGRSCRR